VLIKPADDQSDFIDYLERQAAGTGPKAKQAAIDLRVRKAGLKGEAESAFHINFDFEDAPNWAVIHDLRLEHRGRVAQIDHLLINRWMDFYVLETKHFQSGIKITEDGEFLRWNEYKKKFEGMLSPIMQNERHIAVLRDALSTIDLPVRLGLRITPTFQTFVLVAPSARIDRPKRFDTSRVIKADQLKSRIWKDIDDAGVFDVAVSLAKVVSRDTVEIVARQIAGMHRPLPREVPNAEPARQVPAPSPVAPETKPLSATPGPFCKGCKGTSGEILYGRYGYYFKCSGCEANTSIRFECQPGHSPKLRKEGPSFYRECAQCESSMLFHKNA